ncbi:M1 family metallopeptidase [Ferruginibacter albus]|uniref:M1 family metallopeptidase n=1 Tax=Ferruginibacter albus TaxID=2875540 RepID=UPI001CC6D56C|nr:M1 family metallopeptidase [Ferruginibacter albus]UAY51041.1 M1 family metallopeptidase [Ferruginibacter albus]
MKKLWLLFGVLIYSLSLQAQQLFQTVNFTDAIKKGTRTATGLPGKSYWQNRGDYKINVEFDPSTNSLKGEETISYFNNSPDSLKKLIIRLYPDLYKHGVQRGTSFPVTEKDLNDGVTIDELQIGEERIDSFASKTKAYHSNTNLIVLPANAVLPHSQLTIKVKWHYTVNIGSQVRTGRVDSGSYFIAYFFPRIAVYDDIDGWDDWSYNGTLEFYNDFGNFDITITVPKTYAVWATGERQNVTDNFSTTVLKKLSLAERSDTIVHVIDSLDYANNTVFSPAATGIWRFKATNVTDVAFALSDHYYWDASTVVTDYKNNRTTLASAVYNPIHKDYYDVANQAYYSVFYMSYNYPKVAFPFPYITVFDGTDQMEYPMMVNDNPLEDHKDAVQLTTHEIFHSYFPFYMGINETKYAWMDEGWATIGEAVTSSSLQEPEDEGIYSKTRFERISGTVNDVPLITNTELYGDMPAYAANSYGKAAVCYWVLQNMLGKTLFLKALKQYMDDWNGKHPTPYDFFYSFNASTGKNLNWFWQKWFYDLTYPDLEITEVTQTTANTKIVITNKGGLPVPVYLMIKFDDKRRWNVLYRADVWQDGKKQIILQQKFPFKIRSIHLGFDHVPDKFMKDNDWKEK